MIACNNFWFDDSLIEIVGNINGLKTLNIGKFILIKILQKLLIKVYIIWGNYRNWKRLFVEIHKLQQRG
jgi:hypothetical protein